MSIPLLKEKVIYCFHNLANLVNFGIMKALQLNSDKELNIVDVEIPEVKPNEVLVKVKASALNHRELWLRKGLYPGMSLPCILGADGAGTIEKIGDDVNEIMLGKDVVIYPAYDWGDKQHTSAKQFRVLGMPDPGTMAEYIAILESNVVIKPEYLTWPESAAMPLANLTAWRALKYNGKVKKGDKVLITGIGGGVAQAGLSFCPHLGVEVYVTSSSPEKIEQAVAAGAKGGVNYKNPDWPLEIKEMAGKIDLVLDSSPPAELDSYMAFLNMGARIVYYGSTGSRSTQIKNMSRFFLKHISFIGSTMGSPSDFFEMIAFMEQHEIRPTVDKTFAFKDALKAFDALESGQQVGKIVLQH